jgi:hypothetical protein
MASMGNVRVPVRPDLDHWLPEPALRVAHRREGAAPAERLWHAARALRLRDTALLGRLIRWRIPGTAQQITFDELFRAPPFTVLCESETSLVAGLVGKIWTFRRDYPLLEGSEEFRSWSRRGTARVLFANWVEDLGDGRAALHSESRVEPFGRQGRIGVALVRPVVARFGNLVGSDGIAAAVQRAEQADA